MAAHPTIHDVARVAGVGIGTVSRVLNDHPSVRPSTRARVHAAITQLGFKPNSIAQSMISKRTNSIGVIVPFFSRPFHTTVLCGVQKVLFDTQKELVIYNVENSLQRDTYFSELPMRRKVDGLLIISLAPDDMVARSFLDAEIPTVLVDAYSPYLTSLVVDNVDGAYRAVKSLIDKGHIYIGFINGVTEGNFRFNQANDRLIGYHRALGEADLLFDPRLIVESEWTRLGGYAAALTLLARNPRPTAIFAASDMQAVGVLEAARKLHIPVPIELAIIGFDGIEIAELLDISTVQQPMQQMGEMGVVKLIEQMTHLQHKPELIRLSPTLVERGTSRHELYTS